MRQPPDDAIAVFHDARSIAQTASFSPSASKPELVVAAWQRAGFPIRIHGFPAAATQDLELAHHPRYVRDVLACMRNNGFGNRSPDVARSLPFTTGAMLAAARHALQYGCACAPVSGFHHARYDSGGGYCTFNGLMVTARKLLIDQSVERILILDCDMHFGDGTAQIIDQLDIAKHIDHASFGRWFHHPRHAEAYLDKLHAVAQHVERYDLVLYQAGADLHIDDPLGGVLDTDQMIERDRIVFDAARRYGTPIAWNLAGGYQDPIEKIVALHVATMRACVHSLVGDSLEELEYAPG